MKVALNLAFGSILVAGIAYARIAYVRHFHVHSKDAVLGEALDPMNIAATIGLFAFGALAVIFLLSAMIIYLTRRSDEPV